jgi:hypothetical protein
MSAAVVRLTMYSAHKSGATLVALAQPHFALAMQVTARQYEICNGSTCEWQSYNGTSSKYWSI